MKRPLVGLSVFVRQLRDGGWNAEDPGALGTAWSGVSDSNGVIQIPEGEGVLIVVRHPDAASRVIRVSDPCDPCQLSPSTAPLSIIVHAPGGAPLSPGWPAWIRIWLDGIRLDPQATAFAFWTSASTGPGGVWTARGVSAMPVRLLASRRIAAAQIATGAYDGMAAVIQFPWNSAQAVASLD